MSIFKSS